MVLVGGGEIGRIQLSEEPDGRSGAPAWSVRMGVAKNRAPGYGGNGLDTPLGVPIRIVKHLAQAMNGSVELKSQPGKGSIFRVKLKLVE